MKKIAFLLLFLWPIMLFGCAAQDEDVSVLATTRPVYDLTSALCEGTQLSVSLLISENVSCLHDYSLSTAQMKKLENAQLVILSGGGLENLDDALLQRCNSVCDASVGVPFLECHEEHEHEHDAHIWLSPENAKIMAQNICESLIAQYPAEREIFERNLASLLTRLDELQSYGEQTLRLLSCRELVTFHDGFAYLAQAFDLTILAAVEEESGSEASARDLIELIETVRGHDLPAIFVERNGSTAAASIIARETGVRVLTLDMCMGEGNYFDSMYHNIDSLKEALG